MERARERLAIAALALAAFALNLNTNVLGALLPFVRADLGLEGSDETYLVAAAAAGSAVGALMVAPFAARHGRRRTLLGGLAVFVAASLAHPAAASAFWPFLALRTISGLAVGVAYATASALVAEVSPYARRGSAMGWFAAGLFLAIPIGMPLSVVCARAGHWPAIFAVQAAFGALGWWGAFRAVPPSSRPEAPGGALSVLGDRAVVATLVATMLHVGSFFTTVQLATTWLDETGRVAKEDQVFLWVGLGLLSVLGSMVFGRLSDRVGKRAFVLATSAVLVACFAVLARQPGLHVLAVVASVLAVTASARTGPLQALLSGFVPAERFGAVMGLRGCAMQVGVVAFALAAQPASREFGFRGVLMLGAGCQLLSYAAIRFWAREPR
jgi:predicted MFS family arabinose efflux permease